MNWLHTLWFGYFWPSLQGNGPEALVQTIVYGLIALIFIPPVRRWMGRHIQSVKDHVSAEHAKIHERLDHSKMRHEQILQSMDELHAKVDAVTPAKAPVKKATPRKAVK